MFRNLKANEIECRVGVKKENGFSILLYKDARCDMAILDETVGQMNWTREQKDNGVCRVSIFDNKKNMWIYKEDVGSPTDYEKEKGQASDSFKRACFNWGIGRELYTAPFIWISDVNLAKKKIKVADIEISDKRIISLMLECEGKCIFSRELYTAPFIWISDVNLAKKKIKVADIEISDKRIISLMLECEGKCIFSWTSEEYRKIKGIEEIKKKCDDMKKITNLLKEYNKNNLEECELDEIKKIYKKIS